jgi:hypothetical protein
MGGCPIRSKAVLRHPGIFGSSLAVRYLATHGLMSARADAVTNPWSAYRARVPTTSPRTPSEPLIELFTLASLPEDQSLPISP